MQSEALLAGLALGGHHAAWLLLMIAATGNTLGAAVNWALGLYIEKYRDRKWFPFSPTAIEKAQAFYNRYGKWSLLLSWMPFVGDPLTLMAGMMRLPLPVFLAIVGMAKTLRYAAVLYVAGAWR